MNRPAGRYLRDLDVTVCSAENYASAVIAGIAKNIDHAGRFIDRDPEDIGDVIVHHEYFANGRDMRHVTRWYVRIGGVRTDVKDEAEALAFVRAVRGVAWEAA